LAWEFITTPPAIALFVMAMTSLHGGRAAALARLVIGACIALLAFRLYLLLSSPFEFRLTPKELSGRWLTGREDHWPRETIHVEPRHHLGVLMDYRCLKIGQQRVRVLNEVIQSDEFFAELEGPTQTHHAVS
jgi:hypothetical protein